MASAIILASQLMYAQKVEVNTSKSQVKWFGKKITGQHEGTIQLKSGHFELQDDQIVSGNFVVDMQTITNTDLKDEAYNQKLVNHLKSDDFFGVSTFPTADFTVTESSKFMNGKATISGEITIKGKTEKITFEVIRKGNEYTTQIEIDRSKFNVRYGSNSFFDNLGNTAIDDIFTLDIRLAVNQ